MKKKFLSSTYLRGVEDYQIRFFEKEDEILRLPDGNMLVCSQWGILNISNFIKRAERLGYEVEQIVRE